MNKLAFKLLTGAVAFGLTAGAAQANLINLVQNGEFETTGEQPGKWAPVLTVPSWYSSEGRIEIWAQSFQWDGDQGTDGLATGQHAEITWNTDKATIATNFLIPHAFTAGSTALFSFDYRDRKSSGVMSTVRVNGTDAGSLSGSSRGSWDAMSLGMQGLAAGDNVELLFSSMGGGSSGAHIDQVEFWVHTNKVPVPATLALLGLGLAGVGCSRRART